MGSLMLAVVTYIRAFFVPRHKLAFEAAALWQQLAVFKRLDQVVVGSCIVSGEARRASVASRKHNYTRVLKRLVRSQRLRCDTG